MPGATNTNTATKLTRLRQCNFVIKGLQMEYTERQRDFFKNHTGLNLRKKQKKCII